MRSADTSAGEMIESLIEAQGRTKAFLAHSLGISPSYLGDVLAGRKRGPEGLYTRLARILGVPVDLITPEEET